MKTLDERINALNPGQQITISEYNGIKVIAERSGNGKTVRFVRQTASGFTVFKIASF